MASEYESALRIAQLLGTCVGAFGVFWGLFLKLWSDKTFRPAIEWTYILLGMAFIFIFHNFLFPRSLSSVAIITLGIAGALVVGSFLAAVAYFEAEVLLDDE